MPVQRDQSLPMRGMGRAPLARIPLCRVRIRRTQTQPTLKRENKRRAGSWAFSKRSSSLAPWFTARIWRSKRFSIKSLLCFLPRRQKKLRFWFRNNISESKPIDQFNNQHKPSSSITHILFVETGCLCLIVFRLAEARIHYDKVGTLHLFGQNPRRE